MISSRQNCFLTSIRLTKFLPTSLSVLTNSSLFSRISLPSYSLLRTIAMQLSICGAPGNSQGFCSFHEKACRLSRQLHNDIISKNFRQAIFKGIFDFLRKKYGIFGTYNISTKHAEIPQDMEVQRLFKKAFSKFFCSGVRYSTFSFISFSSVKNSASVMPSPQQIWPRYSTVGHFNPSSI